MNRFHTHRQQEHKSKEEHPTGSVTGPWSYCACFCHSPSLRKTPHDSHKDAVRANLVAYVWRLVRIFGRETCRTHNALNHSKLPTFDLRGRGLSCGWWWLLWCGACVWEGGREEGMEWRDEVEDRWWWWWCAHAHDSPTVKAQRQHTQHTTHCTLPHTTQHMANHTPESCKFLTYHFAMVVCWPTTVTGPRE